MITEPLTPFGLVVTSDPAGAELDTIAVDQIHAWIAEHRVLVLRDFASPVGPKMARYCASLGECLKWSFGLVNELHIKEDTENYLFTDAEVPLHWDGAFVGKIPHYIFFHCIAAPPQDVGGETLFSDTARVLDDAALLAQYKQEITELKRQLEQAKQLQLGGAGGGAGKGPRREWNRPSSAD